MPTAFATQAENLLAGTFLARAVYGAEYIASEFWVGGDDDAEKADDYRGYVESQGDWQVLDASDLSTFNDRGGDAGFTANGLYDARVLTDSTSSFDAQGLLAVKDGNTLVITFRGTDGKDPAVETGQAFTGYGLAQHYKGFKPLINAALDYLKAHPEITDVVVSGHSLGGAVADVFTLVDADRFEAVRPGHVTIVSLASSGVPPDLANYITGIDPSAATIVDKVVLDAFGVEVTTKEITDIHRPAGYFSITNSEDRPHFASYFPTFRRISG